MREDGERRKFLLHLGKFKDAPENWCPRRCGVSRKIMGRDRRLQGYIPNFKQPWRPWLDAISIPGERRERGGSRDLPYFWNLSRSRGSGRHGIPQMGIEPAREKRFLVLMTRPIP
jgi:hypothetical protein